MAKTLKSVIAGLPALERAGIRARTRELIAEEMSLKDLRKAVGKTQQRDIKRAQALAAELEE